MEERKKEGERETKKEEYLPLPPLNIILLTAMYLALSLSFFLSFFGRTGKFSA